MVSIMCLNWNIYIFQVWFKIKLRRINKLGVLTNFIIAKYIFYHQVMIQKHNRQMSFSSYISALAVSDTVVLLGGMYRFLNWLI